MNVVRSMKGRKSILLLIQLVVLFLLWYRGEPALAQQSFVVMSYNVENLFDLEDNPQRDDDEFLPEGNHHWTRARYERKLHQLAEVLSCVGSVTSFPDLVGLVEVENARVLQDLLHHTALGENTDYSFAVSAGEDPRGINVALLYRKSSFTVLSTEEIALHFPFDSLKRTRPILHVSGRVNSGDTLHVFVCHLPSRRAGAVLSDRYRRYAGLVLRSQCDRLGLREHRHTHALILGDFNGNPGEAATFEALGSRPISDYSLDSVCHGDRLFELSPRRGAGEPPGTYCFRGVWSQLDQIHVTDGLIASDEGFRYEWGSAEILFRPFLGKGSPNSSFPIPYRTYGGPHYQGGYSDHYPILARFWIP